MGNNTSRSTQWSEEPVKPTGPLCGAVQPAFPHKTCNRKPKHDGDHCESKQCGTVIVTTWWDR